MIIMLQSELNIRDNLQTYSIEHHSIEQERRAMIYCADADDWATPDSTEYTIEQLFNNLENQ